MREPRKDLNIIGRIADKLGMLKFYYDGDFFTPSLRLWHPLSWLAIICLSILVPLLAMFTDATVKELFHELYQLMTVSDYFKKNPERLKWKN